MKFFHCVTTQGWTAFPREPQTSQSLSASRRGRPAAHVPRQIGFATAMKVAASSSRGRAAAVPLRTLAPLALLALHALHVVLDLPTFPAVDASSSSGIRPLFSPRARLTLINGVAHSLDHLLDASREVSDLFGGQPVDHFHNPTAMKTDDDYYGWGLDLTQAGTQKLGRRTAEVDDLVSHLRLALSKAGPNGRVVHVAHSQGALITRLATERMSPDELKRIEVVCFGGGAAMRRSSQTPFARCVNYYSVNDPILAIVPSAERALRSGFLGVCSRQDGGSDSGEYVAEEPEFVFLTPREGDPIEDHQLLGLTYGEALGWEGRRFVSLYHPAPYRAAKAIGKTAGPIALSVHRTNVAILKKTVVPLILAALAIAQWLWERCGGLARAVVSPLLGLLQVAMEVIGDAIHTWRGGEEQEQERYDPIPA